jgi:hypothetical protein
MLKRAAIAMTIASLLAGGGAFALTNTAGAQARTSRRSGPPTLVYESIRPNFDVSITRKGDRIPRMSVGAPGLCSNGEELGSGFEVVGGSTFRVARDGTFHDPRGGSHTVFRGRFEGDKVVGVFREHRIDVGGDPDFPTLCGNLVPHGRLQHFVAHLVEKNGRAVPHPPIRTRASRAPVSRRSRPSRSRAWRP